MTVSVITGDCLSVLRGMAPQSVHTCVSSPPYWGLRDYGHAGQLGLESTPDAYVAGMVEVFSEVRRVLRDDGTVWLNLGDSYGTVGNRNGLDSSTLGGSKTYGRGADVERPDRIQTTGLKPKDLCGIPWRVAFALQADGWYLRSDIIWSKPNPMPESVTDRPTKAHEYIFLLSKQERYYYDADAIKEPIAESQVGRVRADPVGGKSHVERGQHSKGGVYETGRSSHDCGTQANDSADVAGRTGRLRSEQAPRGFSLLEHSRDHRDALPAFEIYTGQATKDYAGAGAQNPSDTKRRILKAMADPDYAGRNKRSVWTVTTKPYSGAHFATFPPDLIEPCILAGCPERVCMACGAPWVRVIGASGVSRERNLRINTDKSLAGINEAHRLDGKNYVHARVATDDFEPSCQCNAHTVPGTVLDPFFGAGTTGLVADRLQRNCVGIELNPEYADLARNRIRGDSPLFAEVA